MSTKLPGANQTTEEGDGRECGIKAGEDGGKRKYLKVAGINHVM
jgi:hypothetical protein